MLNYKKITIEKIKRKIRHKVVSLTRGTFFYPFFYKSYWHYLFHTSNKKTLNENHYYTAQPNPGAGIGHQIQNWIAGFKFAQDFHCHFAHLPFSTSSWEAFLGFGRNYPTVQELKKRGFKIRKLPLFNEDNENEKLLCKKIIDSYAERKIIFIAEQDQFYRQQTDVLNELQRMFYSIHNQNNDHLEYKQDDYNIAIHVRRGDIMVDPSNPNLTMRVLSNDYFEKVLTQTIDFVRQKTNKNIHIWFFSQGKEEDYPEFSKFDNIHWCFNMNAQQSFLHMVYADALITSKSSFSYNPALLNRGIKVAPQVFWHGYPSTEDWYTVDNNGNVCF